MVVLRAAGGIAEQLRLTPRPIIILQPSSRYTEDTNDKTLLRSPFEPSFLDYIYTSKKILISVAEFSSVAA